MDAKTVARFWSKVDKRGPDECWPWTAYVTPLGYGRFGVRGGPTGAHRVSYEIAHGEHPSVLFVCHRCDNRRCVNPGHLFLGDARVNHDDMVAKGRRVNHIGERHGRAKLTDAQARLILSLKGARTQTSLASEFGVTQTTISIIHRGLGWTHLIG